MIESLNFKDTTSWHFAAWAALLVSIMANLPTIDMVFHKVQEVETPPHGPGHHKVTAPEPIFISKERVSAF